MSEQVEVRLGTRSYPVVVGSGVLRNCASRIREHGLEGRAAIITDSNVGPLYADAVAESLRQTGSEPVVLTVPAGEPSKSLACAGRLIDDMIAAGLDRTSFVVALGGGVIGDLAGFVAAIYFRGIPLVQIPTSLVAQVDSSVGGKTGVNTAGGKNLIGAFHQPRLVIADVDTLRTLPPRELNEGFAEIIKHALIADPALFAALPEPALHDWSGLIRRNVAIKARIVEADERETSGLRALLNLGHTVGHAIENAAAYGTFLHGEAISLGLVAACHLSQTKAGLPDAAVEAVLHKLRHFHLPTVLPQNVGTEAVMAALDRDKKFVGGRVRFVLLRAVGEAFVADSVTRQDIRDAIETLRGGSTD